MGARNYPLEGRMADDTGSQEPIAPEGAEQDQEPQETDWKAESRKWESRAKANLAKAQANEDAAKRLAELEDEQKTEAQKVQERLEAAEKRAAELELRSIRAEVAAAKGVPASLLHGSTQEDLEKAADDLLAYKGEPVKGPVIPSQGVAPQGAPKTTAELFADAFGSGD